MNAIYQLTIDSFPIVLNKMLLLRPFTLNWFISNSVAKVDMPPGSKSVCFPFCALTHTGMIERTQYSLRDPVTPQVSII